MSSNVMFAAKKSEFSDTIVNTVATIFVKCTDCQKTINVR